MLYRFASSFIIGVSRRRSRRATLLHNHCAKKRSQPFRQLSFFSSTTTTTTTHHQTPSTSRIDTDFTSKLPTHVTFLTDVEGDGLYFDRFIHHSQILGFRSVTPSFGRWASKIRQHGVDDLEKCGGRSGDEGKWNYGQYDEEYFPYDKEAVFLDDNSALVYGGDVWDKGGCDFYVMRQLLSLKRRYPERVHFLMGNRDINKMRIVDELGGVDTTTSLPKHEGVYWHPRGLSPTDPKPSIPSDSAAERLKWMLGHTMGSVHAFEYRRDELKREQIAIMNATSVSPSLEANQMIHVDTVSDEEVAQSYIRSCCPVTGIMGKYLMHAKLVIRFGPVLFLHGALPIDSKIDADDKFNHFPTPWLRPSNDGSHASGIHSLAEWIFALNCFASSQVNAWKEYAQRPRDAYRDDAGVWATKGGYFNNTPAGKKFGALMQYGMGRLSDNATTQSCVYSSWMEDGLPREDIFGCDNSMTTFSRLLENEGIQIILTGHRPVGDAPWPIKIPQNIDGDEATAWVIPCDTSYSGDTRWATVEGFESFGSTSLGRGLAKSGRGDVAFSEPLIQICPTTGKVNSLTLHGCLSDGSLYETENMMNIDKKDNFLCGRSHGPVTFKESKPDHFKEGMFWVKSKIGERHLVSFGKGYKVWNSFITQNPHNTASSEEAEDFHSMLNPNNSFIRLGMIRKLNNGKLVTKREG